jgi:hypothetical protein
MVDWILQYVPPELDPQRNSVPLAVISLLKLLVSTMLMRQHFRSFLVLDYFRVGDKFINSSLLVLNM